RNPAAPVINLRRRSRQLEGSLIKGDLVAQGQVNGRRVDVLGVERIDFDPSQLNLSLNLRTCEDPMRRVHARPLHHGFCSPSGGIGRRRASRSSAPGDAEFERAASSCSSSAPSVRAQSRSSDCPYHRRKTVLFFPAYSSICPTRWG